VDKYKFIIYVRFSEIAKLAEIYRLKYPNLYIPEFNQKEWLNNH